ncbi:AbrB/MazE/SpoVT family DNA-binding domain-containing protein [Paraburkholderia acidicola]|uniref:AbrB/MazE/SpoVT family DNA-binding domain-containing protein n=1 Tax=Paraburkholderia acidicola TaxID=1912599 RepID=A0ABV1LW73_9BURK
MASATITSKGQVTIPVGVRSDLGLKTGDRIEFVFNEDTGRYELVPATKSVESLKGLVGKPARPVSVEDMNAAIAARGASTRRPSTRKRPGRPAYG